MTHNGDTAPNSAPDWQHFGKPRLKLGAAVQIINSDGDTVDTGRVIARDGDDYAVETDGRDEVLWFGIDELVAD